MTRRLSPDVQPDGTAASWRTLELPSVAEERGTLWFAEGGRHVPFRIERVYSIFGVPREARRAGHAHRQLHEVLLCVAGSYELVLDDGRRRQRLSMEQPNCGVHIPPYVWHELEDFSPGAVALGLASLPYDPHDHFTDYEEFVDDVRRRTARRSPSSTYPPSS